MYKKYKYKNNININKKIHVTYLDNIKNDFPKDILEFLEPSVARQIKLITSMRSLLQALYKLDAMKIINQQINNFKHPELYKKSLLYSFFDILNIITNYKNKIISKDILDKNIASFINQTFKKNMSKISGIIPVNRASKLDIVQCIYNR